MKWPYCGSKNNWRMHKPLWLKFTPGKMDNMRCSSCGHEYIRWLSMFSLKYSKAQRIVSMWHFIVFFISMILVAFIVALTFGK